MSHGDYGFFARRWFTDKATTAKVLTSTDYTTATSILGVKSANHQLFIQKLTISITTYAAKTWTFQDSAGTPVPGAFVSIAATAEAHVSESGTIVFDFGPEGFALTAGKTLNMLMSATGAAGQVHIEAYEKVVDSATNFNQQIDINGNVNSAKTTPANA